MSKNLTVVKKAGLLVNAKYLELVIKNQKHYIGAAVAGGEQIILSKVRNTPTLAMINEIQEAFKEHTVVFAFGDDKSIDDKDMQPFPVMRDGENVTAVVCLDGEFDRHKKPEQPMSGEYQAAIKIGKHLERFAQQGGIAEGLEDDLNQDNFQLLWNNRGSITFLLADGHCKTISGGNAIGGDFSWGYTSNAFGWKENVGEVHAKKQEDKPLSMADKMKSMLSGTSAKAVTVAQKEPSIIPATDLPEDIQNAPAASPEVPGGTVPSEDDLTGCVLVKPDPKVYNTRRLKAGWYEERLGWLPNGYKSGPALVMYPEGTTPRYKLADSKSFQILKVGKAVEDAASTVIETKAVTGPQPQTQTQQQPNTSGMSAAERKKALLEQQTASNNGKNKISEVGGQQSKTSNVSTNPEIGKNALPASNHTGTKNMVNADQLPVISPEMKQRVEVLLKKPEFQAVLGEDYTKIIDPKTFASMEKALPNLAESFPEHFKDRSMAAFHRWPFALLMALGQSDLKALAILAHNLNVDNMRLRMKIQQAAASGMKIAV